MFADLDPSVFNLATVGLSLLLLAAIAIVVIRSRRQEPLPGMPYDRVNFLIRSAFIMAAMLIVVVVLGDHLQLSAATQTTLSVILGRVWGYIDNIYAFEFNTTRTSQKKDDTIKDLTATAATTAATADKIAEQVVAAGGAKGDTVVDDLTVKAQGDVTVNRS